MAVTVAVITEAGAAVQVAGVAEVVVLAGTAAAAIAVVMKFMSKRNSKGTVPCSVDAFAKTRVGIQGTDLRSQFQGIQEKACISTFLEGPVVICLPVKNPTGHTAGIVQVMDVVLIWVGKKRREKNVLGSGDAGIPMASFSNVALEAFLLVVGMLTAAKTSW